MIGFLIFCTTQMTKRNVKRSLKIFFKLTWKLLKASRWSCSMPETTKNPFHFFLILQRKKIDSKYSLKNQRKNLAVFL